MSDAPVLEVDHVSVSFAGRKDSRRRLLSGRRGEFTGLIGSNGVGKTTLLRAILGLQRLDAGEIRVNGAAAVAAQPFARLRAPEGDPRSRRAHPRPRLRRPRTRRAALRVLSAHAKRSAISSSGSLVDVDAERFADSRVGSLSGGEQQRVLIAHALDQSALAAPARRAAGQLRPAERAGGRGAAAPRREATTRRRPAVRARDERPACRSWTALCTSPTVAPRAGRPTKWSAPTS